MFNISRKLLLAFAAAGPSGPAICGGIAAGVAATGVGVAVAPFVLNACIFGFASYATFCAVRGVLGPDVAPGSPGPPNLMDEFCDLAGEYVEMKIEDFFLTEEVTVTVEAVFPTGVVLSGSSTSDLSRGVSGFTDITLRSPEGSEEGLRCCESQDGPGWNLIPAYLCCDIGQYCSEGEICCEDVEVFSASRGRIVIDACLTPEVQQYFGCANPRLN